MTVARRRLVALALLVVAVAAAVTLAVRYAGSGPAAVPAGGSSFESGPVPHVLQDVRGGRGRGRRAASAPRVPLARGAARLFIVGFAGDAPDAPFFTRLARREWGAVLVTRANATTPGALSSLTAAATAAARQAGHVVPLVAAAPGVPGTAPEGPARPATARARATAAATVLRTAGVRMVLAPMADVGFVGGPFAARALGQRPGTVIRAARAAVDAYRAGGVAPAPGSFPGSGAASGDPAAGVATVGLSLPELRAGELRVFRALRRRAPVIQMSDALYAAFDGVTPATLLPAAVDLLRRSGFDGVVLSGSLPATALATGGSVADAAVDALRAGCDLLLVPGDLADQEAAYRAVVKAVRDGIVSRERYEDALARVTALRRRYAG